MSKQRKTPAKKTRKTPEKASPQASNKRTRKSNQKLPETKKEKRIEKLLRLPKSVVDALEREAQSNYVSFTAQVTYVLKQFTDKLTNQSQENGEEE